MVLLATCSLGLYYLWLLASDSPGLYDPCEREPTDVCTKIIPQEAEYITASAQVRSIIVFKFLFELTAHTN